MAAARAAYMAIAIHIQNEGGEGCEGAGDAGGVAGVFLCATVKLAVGLGSLTMGSIALACQK